MHEKLNSQLIIIEFGINTFIKYTIIKQNITDFINTTLHTHKIILSWYNLG